MTHSAACCCGACEIELVGEPSSIAICSCASCKKCSGSAFRWSVYFPDNALHVKRGAFKVYTVKSTAPSGPVLSKRGDVTVHLMTEPARLGEERYFCANCGTTVYSQGFNYRDDIGVAGGCLTGSGFPPPNVSLSDRERCDWVGLPPETKRT